MPIGAIGGAGVFDIGIAVDCVENVAEQEVGLIVGTGRDGGGAALDDMALDGGKQRKLSLRPGTEDRPHMGQIGVAIENGQEFANVLASFGFGKRLKVEFAWHVCAP